jgi:hypothetical protein
MRVKSGGGAWFGDMSPVGRAKRKHEQGSAGASAGVEWAGASAGNRVQAWTSVRALALPFL